MQRCLPQFGTHVWRVNDAGVSCRECGLHLAETVIDRSNDIIVRRGAERIAPRVNKGMSHARPWAIASERGDGHCFWCRLPWHADRPPTEDHVIPVSKGGTREDGTVLACQTCNGARGDVAFDEYLAAVEAERVTADAEGREYRRPKFRKVGNEWKLTTATRREIRAARDALWNEKMERLLSE